MMNHEIIFVLQQHFSFFAALIGSTKHSEIFIFDLGSGIGIKKFII